jgi:ATPase subunit of ABC transporter with duplicated ATPase domains
LILISGPAMMVLDEPTNHIDDPRIIAVADRVYDWQDGVAVLRAEFEGMPGS